jgi:antitoxin (DNA-binding transcriptional repressor) of toxin-antitoxin stability system
LRRVEAGYRIRIMVNDGPAVDLMPVGGLHRRVVPRDERVNLLTRALLERRFASDIARVTVATI